MSFKTRFSYKGMDLRISKDECGRDRFTKEEIISAIDENTAEQHRHCLCRKGDGKVFAEIENFDKASS